MRTNITYKGDCLEIMPNHIDSNSVDMVLCDLPYGTTNCKWDSVIDLNALWSEYRRVIKDNGVVVLTAQTPFDKVLACSNLEMLRYEWIWEKTQATGHFNAKKMPMKAHENILVFYKHLPTYNPQKTSGHKPVNSFTKYLSTQNKTELYRSATQEVSGGGNTDRYPRSVLLYPSDKQKVNLHPTQKPLSLMEYMIATYTNEGDIVLDNTAGSGTTGRAAMNLNREYIMIEKDEKNYQICLERVGEKLFI